MEKERGLTLGKDHRGGRTIRSSSGDMAEEKDDLESLLGRAREKEREYDWLGAAAVYSDLLSSAPRIDPLKIGGAAEAFARAMFRASFQSNSITEFGTSLDRASESFQKAMDSYGESKEPKAEPCMSRCRAMIEFIGFWRSEKGADKKRSANEAWRLAKKSMNTFETLGEPVDFIATYVELWMAPILCSEFADSSEEFERPYLESEEFGERAIRNLRDEGNEDHLARAHTLVGLLLEKNALFLLDSASRKKDARQRAAVHWKKAVRLSDECAMMELAMLCKFAANAVPFNLKLEELLSLLDIALRLSRRTRDRHQIGCALLNLAYQNEWRLGSIEDPDELHSLAESVVRYATEANENFAILSPPSPLLSDWFIDPESAVAGDLAELETDLSAKQANAKKALESLLFLKTSEELGSRLGVMYARAVRLFEMTILAKTESSPEPKKRILEEAVEQGKLVQADILRLQPRFYFNRGAWLNSLAEAQCELANLMANPVEKVNTLTEAVQNKRDSLAILRKDLSISMQVPEDYGFFGRIQYRHGIWLMLLAELKAEDGYLREAASTFEECAKSFEIAGMPSRAAEGYWKAAQTYEMLGDHTKGSERYASASKSYRAAIERLPRLTEFYGEHALYMQAWSEIEKARNYHVKQDSTSSKECWENAARLHESTKRWRYLSPNYMAWAEVENAENLSRCERSEEAVPSFEKSALLFQKVKESIQSRIGGIEDKSEREMATRLMDAAALRQDYCKARITMEEARILDKRGDQDAASERFGRAAESFQGMVAALDTDKEKQEFQLIAVLSNAWQMMAKAEAEASPELYGEASRLFERAQSLSQGEKPRLMAMGHSRFCRALEAGTKLADTGELRLHEIAAQNLNSAANYYMKAEMEKASEYARASKLLLDGYVYMGKASKEMDQDKKARLCTMAEKVFQASAASFERAGQSAKKEQVERLLEKALEEKGLAVSLTEVLAAPDAMSATTAFSVPTPTHERATGVEDFEHANVQATLAAKPKDLHVGQELNLVIELVNAGRGPAQLTKVEATVPKGFVIVQEPEKYRMEDSLINLRGRRLDALKTEDVRLVVKPSTKGRFRLNPRIMYLDDAGVNRTCEPAPIEIVVKEMGLSGWIKGT